VWRKDAVGLGAGVSNLVRRSVFRRRRPFSGRWRLTQIHRLRLQFPGRGDLLSSVFAGSWLRGWRLSKLCPVGYETRFLWVVATSLWRVKLRWGFLVVGFQWLAVSFWRMSSRRV
ncbi:hypothetical protein HID58_014831, partial [Brassica napus]